MSNFNVLETSNCGPIRRVVYRVGERIGIVERPATVSFDAIIAEIGAIEAGSAADARLDETRPRDDYAANETAQTGEKTVRKTRRAKTDGEAATETENAAN